MLHQLNSQLNHWKADHKFLTELLKRTDACDVVSFDVFDTAVTRLVDSPADAFAEVERRLMERFGRSATGFAAAREMAERSARDTQRKLRGAEEITFAEIYAELPMRLPNFAASMADVADVELAVERDLIVGVPDIREAVAALQRRGVSVLFISDMYLPASFLAEILNHAGYQNWDKLYVSCETGLTKASGQQWTIVGGDYALDRLLHVGDDDWSDVEGPRRFGVRTLCYERARSERRVGFDLTPAILPFSRAQRTTVLAARGKPNAEYDAARAWYDMGRVLGGIVLGGFVTWLAHRVLQHGIERLYFCARDGSLMQRAWHAAEMPQRTGIADSYLYVSRRPLNLALGFAKSTPRKLTPDLLSFLSRTSGVATTVRHALERVGLSEEHELVAEMSARFGSLEHPLTYPNDTQLFETILERHAACVLAKLESTYTALNAYLRQEDFGDGTHKAIVDMGWHGTMQSCLRQLAETQFGPVSLCGFYYGLWPAALKNRYAAGWMEPAFASDFLPIEEQEEIHNAVAILEQLHSASHGTVRGYREEQGRWVPELADSPSEMSQYETATRHFQDGALATVAELFADGPPSGPLAYHDLSLEAVRAALGAICVSPSRDDLRLLSQLGHCSTFDHASLTPIVRECCPERDEQMWEAFWRSDWRVGMLRTWYDNAQGDTRVRIRDFAHAALGQVRAKPRSLRQFW